MCVCIYHYRKKKFITHGFTTSISKQRHTIKTQHNLIIIKLIKKQRSQFDPIRAACIEFQQVEPKEHASTSLKTFSIYSWNLELGQLDVFGKQNKPNCLQRELEAASQLMCQECKSSPQIIDH